MNIKNNFIVNYLQEVKTELTKVVWPTKKDTFNHTMLVIGISIFVALFLGALDYLFSFIFDQIIIK